MSRDPNRLKDYLSHILKAIEQINVYIEDMTELTFLNHSMVQDAVLRNLEIIGEASHNIERKFPEFEASHPELPLAPADQMRHSVMHGYFKVDLEMVWKTLHKDLPTLYLQVQALIQDLPCDHNGSKKKF